MNNKANGIVSIIHVAILEMLSIVSSAADLINIT